MCLGLDNGAHIGAICEAIMNSGIEVDAWSPKQLKAALEADMKATGWSWPDRIQRPGAFLASRLRRLPARPAGAMPRGASNAATLSARPAIGVDSAGRSREESAELTAR